MSTLENKIVTATKWSAITELTAKLIAPITNIILARLLAPEAFGVVATVTMITSFADMFTDAGFQKYLVQHNFQNEDEKNQASNVAFWTNLSFSLLIWGVISVFSEKIATMVGNSGLENLIIVACIQLPLTAFSSIQMAVYRRDFNFKDLFLVRIIGILIPFFVTIPLAFFGFSYWALVLGTLCGNLSNAILLTVNSKWRPQFIYNFYTLKKMLSFSVWSLVESISIWLTTWCDTFIIGSILSAYYLGLYKTSQSTVNLIFSLITSTTTPILFSALSRVQNDEKKFNNIYYGMQRIVAYLVLPMSVGIYLFSDLVVTILLGENWKEASGIIGKWGLMTGIIIVLGHYSSEVYRSKGKPKLSFIAQVLHLILLFPSCLIAAKVNFITLINIRALVRLQFIFIHLILMHKVIGISVWNIFSNIKNAILCTMLMGIVAIMLKSISVSLAWQLMSIFLCILIYLCLLLCFKSSREDLKVLFQKIRIVDKVSKINQF